MSNRQIVQSFNRLLSDLNAFSPARAGEKGFMNSVKICVLCGEKKAKANGQKLFTTEFWELRRVFMCNRHRI